MGHNKEEAQGGAGLVQATSPGGSQDGAEQGGQSAGIGEKIRATRARATKGSPDG